VFFFVLFFYSKPRCAFGKTKQDKKIAATPTSEQSDKWYRIEMLVLMFAFFVVYLWLEAIPGRFVAMFVVKGLGWRNKYGALITSLFWGSNGLGRVIGIPLSTVMTPRNMLITDMLVTTFAVILLWFSPMHSSIPWVGSAILGYGLATIFASVVLWVDTYMEVTGTATGVFLAGASFGSMTAPLLTGVLFDDFGYMWFVYILFIANCLLVLLYAALTIRVKRHGKRQKPTKDDKEGSELALDEQHVNLTSVDSV
jgi:fucose permease